MTMWTSMAPGEWPVTIGITVPLFRAQGKEDTKLLHFFSQTLVVEDGVQQVAGNLFPGGST